MRFKVAPIHNLRSRQTGVAAVFAGISMVALLAALALTIDLGRLYMDRQELQKLASLAAMDTARTVSRCDSETVPTIAEDIEPAVGKSLDRNYDGYEGDDIRVAALRVGEAETDPNSGLKSFVEGDVADATAVQVTLERPMELIFPRPGLGDDPQIRVSATAEQIALGSFFLGTELVGVNGGLLNQILGGLLCDAGDTACQNNVIALDVASSSSGLLGASVNASQLATALNLTVEDLADPVALNTATPLLSDVINDLATELSGSVSVTVTNLLEDIGSSAADREVPVGELFGPIETGAGQAPLVNVFDLLVALGQSAQADDSGVNSIELPVGLSLPAWRMFIPFSKSWNRHVSAGLGRPGEAMARSAQVEIAVRISLVDWAISAVTNLVNQIGNLLGVSISLNILQPDLGIDIVAGGGEAFLDRIQCPRAGENDGQPIAELSAGVATTSILVDTFSGDPATAPPLDGAGTSEFPVAGIGLSVLFLGSTNIDLVLDATSAGIGSVDPPQPLDPPVTEFEEITASDNQVVTTRAWRAHGAPGAPSNPHNPQTVTSSGNLTLNLGLNIQDSDGSGLLGLLSGLVATLVNQLLDLLEALLQPLLDLVNGLVTDLVEPLLSTLGIHLGEAKVTMHTVTVGHPRLVTTVTPPPENE